MSSARVQRHPVHAAALLLVLIALGSAAPAAAQSRRGFWIGGGAGIASAAASIGEADLDRDTIPALHLEGGWTIGSRTLVGLRVESLGLRLAELPGGPAQDTAVIDFIGTIAFHPRAGSNWFVQGGVGATVIDDIDGADSLFDVSGSGVGVLAGVGYDIPLGRLFALTPGVSYRYGRVGTVRIDGEPVGRWSHNVVAATVSLFFR